MEGFSSCSSSRSRSVASCPAASRATAASAADTHLPSVPCTMIVMARCRQNHGSTGALIARAQ